MRPHASVLHLDLDAFFAAVEQRDKPSLRGKPVVVGGIGPRGVVATASYEARRFGIRSAMSSAEARSRCSHAAFLSGRFPVYREASRVVMDYLRSVSDLVEPLSLDEAFVDLAAAPDFDAGTTSERAQEIRARIPELTNGLTASVGLGSSKLIAKIASEFNKPDGLHVVPAGSEPAFLSPLPVTSIPGVGPVTAAKLRQVGVHTIAEVRALEVPELTRIVGHSAGASLYRLSRGQDDRSIASHRETKSVSVEDTFAQDISRPEELSAIADRQARNVAERLAKHAMSARTVTVKIRFHDFETHTRSSTLPGPTDDPGVISRTARSILAQIDTGAGLRLLGVGVSGLADWVQDELFPQSEDALAEPAVTPARDLIRPRWLPGLDVEHRVHGKGWVWGSGLGRVTVRFETRDTPAGPILTFSADDPALRLIDLRHGSDTVES